MFFDYRRHLEGKLNAIHHTVPTPRGLQPKSGSESQRSTVLHENELAVRRDEGDGAVAVEFAQLDALAVLLEGLGFEKNVEEGTWWKVMSANSMPVPLEEHKLQGVSGTILD